MSKTDTEVSREMARLPRSLLGDTAMLRLACVLYLDPSAARSLGELTGSLPGANRMTVIRALRDLTEQGYVQKLGGNPPTYRANPRHYLFDEVRSIAVKTLGGFEGLTALIAQSSAVRFAAVYGSFASGTAGPSSDIDLLLVVTDAADPAVAAIVSDLAEAAQALGRQINPTIYDEPEFTARRGSGFLSDVLASPLMVLKDARS